MNASGFILHGRVQAISVMDAYLTLVAARTSAGVATLLLWHFDISRLIGLALATMIGKYTEFSLHLVFFSSPASIVLSAITDTLAQHPLSCQLLLIP